MSERQHMLPVWFFIGMPLTVYGVIIVITSLIDWSVPSRRFCRSIILASGAGFCCG